MADTLNPIAKGSPESLSPVGGSDSLYHEQVEGKKKTYICQSDECGKTFRYKSEILRHIATHSEQRPHTCPYESCSKSFKRSDALENHLRTHTKETPFTCKVAECGLTFTTKASLRYHILKHKNQKVHKCSFPGCNKAFITIFQLKQHEKSTGVHKKITTTPEVNPQPVPAINLAQAGLPYKMAKIEVPQIPPFFKAETSEWNGGFVANAQTSTGDNYGQEGIGDQVRNIVSENHILKKKLELSQKIIGLLQQKIQFDTLSVPEYAPPELMMENFMRFNFYNKPENC